MDQVKLDSLLIKEVSGVDDPANQLPGWMVTKAADGTDASAGSIVAKIKGIVLGAPTGKDDIEMEKQELLDALTERDETLVKSIGEAVAEAVSKAVAPAEGEGEKGAAETTPDAAVAITADDVAKAVTDAAEEITKAYNEILEKVLDRLEGVENALGVAAKKSLEGQEGTTPEGDEETTKAAAKTPDLGAAITAAFKR